jgi:hypothetical protein
LSSHRRNASGDATVDLDLQLLKRVQKHGGSSQLRCS